LHAVLLGPGTLCNKDGLKLRDTGFPCRPALHSGQVAGDPHVLKARDFNPKIERDFVLLDRFAGPPRIL
jgi:hypothetical protein